MMAWILGASALGIALSTPLLGHAAYTAAILLMSLLLCWNQRPQWLKNLGLLWFLLLGFACWSMWRQPSPSPQNLSQHIPCQNCKIIGEIVSAPEIKKPGQQRFKLQVSEIEGTEAEGNTLVSAQTRFKLRYGQKIQLWGQLQAPTQAENFGEFSYRDYLARQGIFSLVKAHTQKPITILAPPTAQNILARLHQLKTKVDFHFNQALTPGDSALLGSLVFGSQASPVPEEIQTTFQKVGLQHVLAVSGFQVNLLVVTLLVLCQACRLPRWLSCALILILMWLFVALTGFPASVLRAGMIASLGILAFLCFQQIQALQALLFGGWLLLLCQPLLLWDLGFQFSFLATLGLILATETFETWLDFLPLFLSKALATILAAQILVLPVQLYHFGQFSWLFLPANLIAGIFVPILTWIAIGALPLLLVWPPIFYACGPLIQGVIFAFLKSIELLSLSPASIIHWPQFSGIMVVMAFIAITALLELKTKPWMPYLLLGSSLSLPLLAWSQNLQTQLECPLQVTYLSIGQGDASLIQAGRKTILIDAGPASEYQGKSYNAGERTILPFLEKQGIKKIDLAIISHAHRDHYGGFEALIEKIPIGAFWGVNFSEESNHYLQFLKQIQAKNIPFYTIKTKTPWEIMPNLRLLAFPPMATDADDHAGINNASLLLKLEYQALRLLWTGDIEAEAENYWQDQLGKELQAQILKVPHHGSKTSSSEAFLAQVQPQEAIISVGEKNRYRHPSPQIIQRYWEKGARIWRTDQQGAISVCGQGQQYTMRSMH